MEILLDVTQVAQLAREIVMAWLDLAIDLANAYRSVTHNLIQSGNFLWNGVTSHQSTMNQGLKFKENHRINSPNIPIWESISLIVSYSNVAVSVMFDSRNLKRNWGPVWAQIIFTTKYNELVSCVSEKSVVLRCVHVLVNGCLLSVKVNPLSDYMFCLSLNRSRLPVDEC